MRKKKRAPVAGKRRRGSEKRLADKLDTNDSTISPKIFEGPDTRSKQSRVKAAFNKFYAIVNENGRCIVYRRVYDPLLKRFMLERTTREELRKFYENRKLKVWTGSYNETKSAVDLWWGDPKRRQFLGGVTCDPSGQVGEDYWNLWTGFCVDPAPGDWSLMQQHILEVLCSGDREHSEYLLNWLARMLQHPELLAEVAVVLRGGKGSGKGTLGNWILRVFGQHGMHVSNAKHVVGNFNAHLRDAVFLFADEAFFAGDRQHDAVLKSLITEPTILIEAKYQNPLSVKNMLHILMASNDDWVVPASTDERRYFVPNVSSLHVDDHDYFDALNEQMKNGGLAAMLHDLLKRDISSFTHRAVPASDALDTQKLHSLDSLHAWWRDVLERGFVYQSRYSVAAFAAWMECVPTELLYRSYLQWADASRCQRRQSRENLGAMMKAMFAPHRPQGSFPVGEVEYADPNSDKRTIEQVRPPSYRVGDISRARAAFCKKTKLNIDWNDEG